MGKFCEICEKGTLNGNRVMVNGTAKRMNVCTRCLRSGNVQRALPKVHEEA